MPWCLQLTQRHLRSPCLLCQPARATCVSASLYCEFVCKSARASPSMAMPAIPTSNVHMCVHKFVCVSGCAWLVLIMLNNSDLLVPLLVVRVWQSLCVRADVMAFQESLTHDVFIPNNICVCIYICMYTYVYICTSMHSSTFTLTHTICLPGCIDSLHACMVNQRTVCADVMAFQGSLTHDVFTPNNMCVCVYIYIYIYVCIHMYIYAQVCIRAHLHSRTPFVYLVT